MIQYLLIRLIIITLHNVIAFDDKNLNIDWILNHDELNLSTKDTTQPKLNETNDLFEFGVDYYA